MLRVRLLSSALVLILTGAISTIATAQNTPATTVSTAGTTARLWFVNTLGTTSETARQEFLQGLRDQDAERFIDARTHFNAAVAADPDFAIAHLYAAFNGGSLGAYRNHLDEAIRLVDKATPAEQLWIRAEQKGADNDVTGQITIAEQLVKLTPTDPRAYGYLSGAQFAANKRAEARATLEKMTQIDPNYAPAWIQLGNSYLVTEPRDIEKAETYIRRAVALSPNESFVHDYMGDVYRAENKLADARKEYTRMAELAPTAGSAFVQRGHVNSFLGNFDEARADYDRAIQLADPSQKQSFAVYRALVNVYAGNPAAAETELDRIAASVDPGVTGATNTKIFALTEEARIALHNKHLDVAQKAIDQLRTVFQQQATEGRSDAFKRQEAANLDYWEGMLAARRGDFATAQQKAQDYMTQMAPDQNPRKNEPAHELFGMIEFLQGNYTSAASHFAEANADDTYVWYYRGLALEGAGRKAEAKEFF
ncbi:MAG TPA: hypothetical protein VJS39_03875, partial [Gemmatimonadaceae bacterium]|nr:hypothetical protein [Gemmatimonadaceae bacterium]